MQLQMANFPLQGLDRSVLTVGALSVPHCQIGARHWHHFTGRGFKWSETHYGEADQLTLASGGSKHA